jgi:Tfp pilus assembly protein PilX
MRRARNEEGFAVVAAVVLLTVIMGLGLGLLLFADNQQKASARQQASEAAFNVAEAALNAQVGQLSRKWPFKEPRTEAEAVAEMPRVCTATGTSTEANDCPNPTDLKLDPNTSSTTCPGTDAWGQPLSNQWTTYVRQEVGTNSLFNSTEVQPRLSYAESEAGGLWVRSVGVVQCHPVAVVTLVTRLSVILSPPVDAIAGNWFKVTNSGKKVIVNRQGEGQPGPVSMRCAPPHERSTGTCEEYEAGSKEQVSPPIGEEHPTTSITTLTPSQLATIKSEAQAYGKFYSSTAPYHCPTSMNELEGVKLSTGARTPVYIEGCGELNIQANGEANCTPSKPLAPESPGFLVIANGTFKMSGKSTYCGVIYAANLNPKPLSEGAIVNLQGGTVVVGGIIVDGAGGIEFGSSGQGGNPANLVFDSLAFHNLTISAGAAATRNSFRILPSGQ